MNRSNISLAEPSFAVTMGSEYVDWKGWPQEDFGKCSRLEAAFFAAELRPLAIQDTPQVLEIGFGNGPFLGWCNERRFNYAGVEIDPVMRARAGQAGATVFGSIMDAALDARCGTFDLVAAFDVIEHIEQSELPATFSRIERMLKRGGIFIAKFPNGDSPFGRVNQHGDLTHVTTLGSGKIHHLASLAGLKVVSFADPKRPWRGVGTLNGARRVVGGITKVVFEASIRALYFGGEKICFDRNAVAVLQK